MKSDQNQPHDPTENWLRQTLGGHRPDAPADAWQRLAPHLPQRKRRRPFAFWLSAGAVGAAAVAALFWFLKNAETPTAPPVSVAKGQPIAQAAPAVLPEKLGKEEATISTEKTAAATVEPFFKNHFSRKNSPKAASGLPEKLTAAAPAFFEKSNGQPAPEHPENLAATAPGKPDFSEKTAPPRTESPLEKLPGNPLAPLVLPEKRLPNFQFSAAPVLSKKAKNPRFWLEIEAAPALFMQKNMGETPGGLVFPEAHPHPGRGWQAGVSLAAEPLKNWRVGIGIQHLRQTHEAAHSATLRLMDGVCLNPHDPGLKEYEFRYAVVSGGERSDLTLRLQQQDIGSAMPDDEPFTLDMKTVHRSAAWRVPLTVERRFGAGKWQGFVQGGAVAYFSEKTQIEGAHYDGACQGLCF
ncbi:MAG: hypothetical protein ACK4Q5_06245, partial [Saprospiraceae bacterium]